jgi:hypothetical protein
MNRSITRVEFVRPIGPRSYVVKISNGSGVKAATVTAGAQSTAVAWAHRWAGELGNGWELHSILPA